MKKIHNRETGKRCLGGRFHHHGTTRGHRRDDLVNNQIDRVVKGADRRNQSAGLPVGVGHPVHRSGVQPHRNLAPVQMGDGLDRHAHPVDGPGHLHFGVNERLPPFREGLLDQFFLMGLEQLLKVLKNLNIFLVLLI